MQEDGKLVYVLVQAVGRSTVRFLTVMVVVAAGHMSFTVVPVIW
jgi:hypothetical protein